MAFISDKGEMLSECRFKALVQFVVDAVSIRTGHMAVWTGPFRAALAQASSTV